MGRDPGCGGERGVGWGDILLTQEYCMTKGNQNPYTGKSNKIYYFINSRILYE